MSLLASLGLSALALLATVQTSRALISEDDYALQSAERPTVYSATALPAPIPAARPRVRLAETPVVLATATATATVPRVARRTRARAQIERERPATLQVVTGKVAAGGTVAQALSKAGVSAELIHRVDRQMRKVFDFRKAHPGDSFALISDENGRLLSFEFQRGRREVFRLERSALGAMQARRSEVPLERRVTQLGGVINRSLFESVRELGERADLVNEFASVFVWDFDFSTQTRPGDEFRMVFEKFYDRDGFARYGNILAAQYKTEDRDYTAVYFEDEGGYGDYYTPDGKSVRRAFLRAPVKYSRISSRYSRSRLHPVLKVRRPHLGVDYAAPSGTPVWAVAAGEVVYKGWNGGFGRLVGIRHNNGYETYYGHLSKYASGLQMGQRVSQRDVVGFVGSSGLSTGPHVDFRVKADGRFVDPLDLRFPQGAPIQVAERERFEVLAGMRLAELSLANPPLVLEAGM